MIELPETYVLAKQMNDTLINKTIVNTKVNTHPHSFAWFADNPSEYNAMLEGKKITKSTPGTGYTCGGNTEILCEDMLLVITTPIKYHEKGAKLPKSHQLLLEFDDGSHLSCTVQMWGSMFCYPAKDIEENKVPEHFDNERKPDPYTEAFDEVYFESLLSDVKTSISAKAFLATEQRIPGLGNGVLQDILFNARIYPKRKLETIGDKDMQGLFQSVKSTLKEMRDNGGRDTEKDLFNRNGSYLTILSKNTLLHPCRVCGSGLVRQAYLGGNIYFCPVCQPM